ncbi:S8 family serine peptidase [Paenibacillus dendritiformis]|uniref:S8 family serine peptidase n=1 Tax=Paenibacillus dendritiformis TaxID=130049 RepID=UPI00365A3A3F
MQGKSWLQRWVILALALILGMTSIPGVYAAEQHAGAVMVSESGGNESPVSIVDGEVYRQFSKGGMGSYIVKLREQSDVESASKLALSYSALSGETSAKRKQRVRSFVVNTLMETADRTQSDLADVLEAGTKNGTVQEYRSYYIVNAIAVTSTWDVMEQLAKHPAVERITPNHTYKLDVMNGNEAEPEQSAAKPSSSGNGEGSSAKGAAAGTGANVPWNLRNLNVPQVWAQGIDGLGVVVANMDSGVDLNHPALQRKWRGYNAEGEVQQPELSWYDATLEETKLPSDGNGHGTHVMGTMLGSEPDGSNPIGVAPQAKWIAARIFNSVGEATDAGILAAGEWIMAPTDRDGRAYPELAPDIVNNSWGNVQAGKNEFFLDIVKAWRSAGIVATFSAGNAKPPENNGGPGSITPPGNYQEAFSVGAVDIQNRLADFSLQGPTPYGQMKPEVSAPGVNVRSSVPGGAYQLMNGTSMAAPHVAGVAALLKQANHSLTVEEVERILQDTAIPLTDDQFPQTPNNGYGHGIVNAFNAVSSQKVGLGALEGEVSIDGVDNGLPVIEHTPLTLVFNAIDREIYAEVSDDTSVIRSELEVRRQGSGEWNKLPMTLISGNHRHGIYEGVIPVSILDKAGIEYRIRAVDYSGNETVTESWTVEVSEGVKRGYKQDFESGIDGFDFGGESGIWEWGVPTTGPRKAYSGDKVIATRLNGNYPTDVDETFIVTPLIDLREGEHTILSFKHWYKLGHWFHAQFDKAEVFIGRESNQFKYELVKHFDGRSDGWKTEYIDLSPYNGDRIYVIFNLRATHGSDEGWYIDDIELIEPNDTKPAAPTLKVRSNRPGRVIPYWGQPPDDVKDYVIYRSTTPGGPYKKIGESEGWDYVDYPVPQEGTYYYVVRARTHSLVLSEPSNEVSWTFTGGDLIFGDDLEGEDNWKREGDPNEWEIGVPDPEYGPEKAVSGSKVIGTNIAGYAAKNAEQSIISPEIDLSGMKHASLYFQEWYDIDDGDKGYVEISRDGGATWHTLASYPKTSYDTNHPKRFWYLDEIGIDQYVGEKVHVRFRLKTGKHSFSKGWYLDDIQVRDTPRVKTVITALDGTAANGEASDVAAAADQPDGRAARQTVLTEEAASAPDLSEWRAAKQKANARFMEAAEMKQSSRLPATATVTIVDTDRSAKTDSGTGRYRLQHPPGMYKMRVEAYGYRTVEQTVTIEQQKTTKADVHLQPLSRGTVAGVITDAATGKPLAGAAVRVMEDAHVPSVMTDEQGAYQLDVYEGEYRLLVSARGYLSSEQQVRIDGNGRVTKDIALESFRGTDGELAYDRGEADNAVAYYNKDSGYAVRMTSDGLAQVTGARYFFWNEGWPAPGGTAFQYALYDADGPDGLPGTRISGPHAGTARMDGGWTEVSFSNAPIVNGDFYVVYLQEGVYPYVPGLSVDQGEVNYGRSWKLEKGSWKRAAASQGNYMIRALVTRIEEPGPVTKITVGPRDNALFEGQQLQLQVRAEDGAGHVRDVTRMSSYSADGDQVIAVDAAGLITALTPGEAEITVTYEGLKDTVRVTVSKIPDGEIRSIAVQPPELSLAEGETAPLTVTAVVYSDEREQTVPLVKGLVFRSEDADIAAVDDKGQVTGLRAGSTAVTVSFRELEARVPVMVGNSDMPPVEEMRSIHVHPEVLSLKPGEALQLTVTAAVYAGNEVKLVPVTEGLTFSSTHPQVAKAEADGRVIALSEGESRIRIGYREDLQTEALVKVKRPDVVTTPPVTERPDVVTPPATERPNSSSSKPRSDSNPAPAQRNPVRNDGIAFGNLSVTDGPGGKQVRIQLASKWLEGELANAKANAPVTLDLSSLPWKQYAAVTVELASAPAERLLYSGKTLRLEGAGFVLSVPSGAIPDFMEDSGLKLILSVQSGSKVHDSRQVLVSGDTAVLVSDVISIGTAEHAGQRNRKREHSSGQRSGAWTRPLLLELELDEHLVRRKQAAGIYSRNEAERWAYAGLSRRIAEERVPGKSGKLVLQVPIQQPGAYAGLEYAKTFADTVQHWGRAQIEALASQHITVGRNDYRFAPNDPVTQAEFMTLLDRITGKEADWKRRSFEPGAHEELRREDMIVLLVTALNPELPQGPVEEPAETALEQVSPEARAAVAYAYQAGLVKGMGAGGFAGDALTTRAQVAVLLYRVLQQMERM